MKNYLTLAMALLFTIGATSQKLKTEDGDLKNLKDIKAYSLIFDYTDVQIPKFDSEEDFLKDKMAKRDEKEAGDGERFKKSWFDDRENRYKPKFIESFNKRFDDGAIKVEAEDATHTMKMHTTKLYAGYNVGIMRHNAEIDVTITVFETGNESNVLFLGSYKDVQGGGAFGNDYDSGYRISECYAKLAKTFAKDLKKRAL